MPCLRYPDRKQGHLAPTRVCRIPRLVLLAAMLSLPSPGYQTHLFGRRAGFTRGHRGSHPYVDGNLLSVKKEHGALWSLKFKVQGPGSGFSRVSFRIFREGIGYYSFIFCVSKTRLSSTLSHGLSVSPCHSLSLSVSLSLARPSF